MAATTFSEPTAVTMALESLSVAIHIACLFALTSERDALVKVFSQ